MNGEYHFHRERQAAYREKARSLRYRHVSKRIVIVTIFDKDGKDTGLREPRAEKLGTSYTDPRLDMIAEKVKAAGRTKPLTRAEKRELYRGVLRAARRPVRLAA